MGLFVRKLKFQGVSAKTEGININNRKIRGMMHKKTLSGRRVLFLESLGAKVIKTGPN